MVGLIVVASLAGPTWRGWLVLASLAGPGSPVPLIPTGSVGLVKIEGRERSGGPVWMRRACEELSANGTRERAKRVNAKIGPEGDQF